MISENLPCYDCVPDVGKIYPLSTPAIGFRNRSVATLYTQPSDSQSTTGTIANFSKDNTTWAFESR
jgi:hypothetical protein